MAERSEQAQSSMSDVERTMVIARSFKAPRQLVFDMWTDAEHLDRWWGPNGFRNTTHEMDFRLGGIWRYTMHGPDGTDYPNRIMYSDITAPERIVYDHDDDGATDAPPFHVTVDFSETATGTTVVMRVVFANVGQYNDAKSYGAVEGGNQTMNRLAEYLESQH